MPMMKDCTYCGKSMPLEETECPHCKASNRSTVTHFCTHCGFVGFPTTFTKGSFVIEIALYFVMILPGILYTLWRLTSRYSGCAKCLTPNMIPATSPVAKAALAQRAQS